VAQFTGTFKASASIRAGAIFIGALADLRLKKLGISLSAQSASSAHIPPAAHAPATPPATPHRSPSGVLDIRGFAAEKNPKTVNERVAVVAYYLAHLAPEGERREYMVSEE
jgi:hypothetical protein